MIEHISVFRALQLAAHLYLNGEAGLKRCFRIAFLLRKLLNKLYETGVTGEQINE